MILKLKNNTTINISASPQSATIFTARYVTLSDLETDIFILTKENLEQYRFESEDGQVFGIYPEPDQTQVELGGIHLQMVGNGYLATFSLKARDMITERLAALEENQGLQDGAIIDLASVIGGE